MKIVMTLVARDDADVVDAQIAFHLNAGVDLVVATDHASTDGTEEVLEAYVRDGHLHRVRVEGEADDDAWRAAMARRAVDELGADWVIDSHVDEFWLPRGPSLEDVLASIPPRYGAVQALTRVFVPRPGDGAFAGRMTVRESPVAGPPSDLGDVLRPALRGTGGVSAGGSREAVVDGRVPLRSWYPIEVLRFPLRSREQARRRISGRSGPDGPRSALERRFLRSAASEGVDATWEQALVADADVERGPYVRDERLRDALRRIERPGLDVPRYSVGTGSMIGLGTPQLADDAAYAVECNAVGEVALDVLQSEIRRLDERIAALERAPWKRIGKRLGRPR